MNKSRESFIYIITILQGKSVNKELAHWESLTKSKLTNTSITLFEHLSNIHQLGLRCSFHMWMLWLNSIEYLGNVNSWLEFQIESIHNRRSGVCVWFRYKILRIGPKGLSGARRVLGCQPKAGTLAWAGRRPAYMLVSIIYKSFA